MLLNPGRDPGATSKRRPPLAKVLVQEAAGISTERQWILHDKASEEFVYFRGPLQRRFFSCEGGAFERTKAYVPTPTPPCLISH